MKARYILIVYVIISIIGLLLLLSRENVYVVAGLFLGAVLLGHRELWSLVRHRRLPVIDERVRDNLTRALRLTGGFFFIGTVVLLVSMQFDVLEDASAALIISGQLVLVGFVYMIGYHYYDRVRPALGTRALRWLKICFSTAGLCLGTVALSIVLHNLISMWINAEEGFFFILAIIVAPAVLVISLLVVLGIFFKGLWSSFRSVQS